MNETWSPDPGALCARVAGSTRGCGRGIAAALGEAGATVVCTGRSSRTATLRSDYDRAETIEETAAMVTMLGGTGLDRPVDHLDPDQLRDLAGWIRGRFGRIDVLVNDIWGAELHTQADQGERTIAHGPIITPRRPNPVPVFVGVTSLAPPCTPASGCPAQEG